MKRHVGSRQNRIFGAIAILPLAILLVVSASAQTAPTEVGSIGYINGTALTIHTSSALNTTGASALVAFVSTNSPWNGLPVSISGISDNQGNNWTLLTGPTTFVGSSFTLVSAIYYINGPATSANHAFTVQLSNPAPLVFHVFAVSGSDVTGPPIVSPIADPGTGNTSTNVTTAPISVPNNSLLLAWAKNETSATASAIGGFSLDSQSTSFLWAETEATVTSGSYTGQFQYASAIGWQAAIVGIKPSAGPVAYNQSVSTKFNTSANITLNATSPQGLPLTYTLLSSPTNGVLSGAVPNLSYSPNSTYIGPDMFTFKVNDGTTDSNVATVSISVQGPVNIVGTAGYVNGTPLTTHTSNPFNTNGASTLVAFVSSHPSWNGLPVSLLGVSDNQGNAWNVLTGPTMFAGSSFTLMSEIYYVNSPITSATHTVSAGLSNPAPLVLHVFAVSGSDVTGPPIFSPITDPGAGNVSANVITAPISVPNDSMLVAWVKNESSASATAIDGYTLDPQSQSFIWAESQTVLSAGSYTGDFAYNSPIGWQTAIVGFKMPGGGPPVPSLVSTPPNPTNQTNASFSFTDTEAGVTFLCQLDGAAFIACSSPAAYSGLAQGSHTFAVKAQDAANNQSTAISFTWSINTTPPPSPTLTSTPANPTNQTNASFGFSDSQAGVSFLCQLDSTTSAPCSSPAGYSGLSQGSHAFSVVAQDSAGNQSSATGFTWTVDTIPPPVPTLTSTPTNPTNQTIATFSFSDSQAGVTFFCQLDGSAFTLCSSSASYSGLGQATHTFSVKAQDAAGNQSGSTTFIWTIQASVVIAFTQVAAATPQSPTQTVTVAFPGVQTAGNLNVVAVGCNDTTSTVQSVIDSAGNNYTLAIGPTTGTELRQSIYYAPNIASGSNTVTVTFRQAATFPDVRILEYSGVNAVDVTAGASGKSATANSGSAITRVANELIFGANMVSSATKAPGSGFTSRIVTSQDGDIAEDKRVTAAGSNTASASLTVAAPWVMQMVTFFAASGPAPTVSSVSPSSGPATSTTPITITGTNFGSGAVVMFGSNAATNVVLVNSTTITATAPAGTVGPVSVTVTLNGQSGTLSNGFTYNPPPSLTSVTPNSGPPFGGTSVTIAGANFGFGARVIFGSTPASNVTVVNNTTITATSPAANVGSVAVSVTNPDGQTGTLTNGFVYGGPAVTSISPTSGPTAGGTAVTITGSNFSSSATVTFGSAPATNVVIKSSTSITATTPPGSAGPVTVTVTNPGAQVGSLPNGYTYVVAPTVKSVSPNNGGLAGGTAVTITGTNFASGATVTFGGSPANNVVVTNGTTITATTPADAAGAVTVTVTVNGQTGSLTNGFTYTYFVQVAAASPQTPTPTVTVTFPQKQTAGDLNVVVVGCNDTSSVVQSVSDSAGNSYNLAIGPAAGTALQQSIYYASGVRSGNNTITVVFSQAATLPDVRILEYRGVSTLDATVSASGNSTTANSGTASITSANELIIGANTVSTGNKTVGSGFTKRVITSPDSDLVEDRAVNSVGSYSATATLISGGPWVMQMITFK
jgi:hypothetical protein